MYGKTRSLPFLLLGIGPRDRHLHDYMEEVVTLGSDIFLGEGCDEFHGFKGALNIFCSKVGVFERPNELLVDLIDLLVFFIAAKDN